MTRRSPQSLVRTMGTPLRALEIDDSLAEAHTALGFYLSFYEWDRVGDSLDYVIGNKRLNTVSARKKLQSIHTRNHRSTLRILGLDIREAISRRTKPS